jgi:hypothetical protein
MDSKKYPTWSIEAEQDFRVVYNIKSADILAKMMAQEITDEIDKEILSDLVCNKQKEENLNKNLSPRSIYSDWEVSRFD